MLICALILTSFQAPIFAAPDTTPPTPGNSGVITYSVTSDTVALQWTAASDDTSLPANLIYSVYHSSSPNIDTEINIISNGTPLNAGGSAGITVYSATGLTPGTTYYFNVLVSDEAGNEAAYIQVSATTKPPDTAAPIPGNSGLITYSVTSDTVALQWTAASDDTSLPANLMYSVYHSSSPNIDTEINIISNGTPLNAGGSAGVTAYSATGLSPGTTYYFNILVEDAAGNTAAYTQVSATTSIPDTTAPIPGNSGVITYSVTYDTVALQWTAATDDTTLPAGLFYSIYRSSSPNIDTSANITINGTQLNTGGTADITAYSATGLTPGTTYYFNILVEDAAGNTAVYTQLQAATNSPPPGSDTVPPTPGNSGTISYTATLDMIDLSWAAATDDTTLPAGLVYSIYRSNSPNIDTAANITSNGTLLNTGGTAGITAYSATGLTSGTTYYFNILVKDAAGNTAVYTQISAATTTFVAAGTVYIYNNGTPSLNVGARVSVYNANNYLVGQAVTDASGRYSINVPVSLQTSTYRITASSNFYPGMSDRLLNAAGTGIESSNRLDISVADLGNANLYFVRPLTIRGSVKDAQSNAPIADATVSSWDSVRTTATGDFEAQSSVCAAGSQYMGVSAWADGYYSNYRNGSFSIAITDLKNGYVNIGDVLLEKIPVAGIYSGSTFTVTPSYAGSGELSTAALKFKSSQNRSGETITFSVDNAAQIRVGSASDIVITRNGAKIRPNTLTTSSDGFSVTMDITPGADYQITFGVKAPDYPQTYYQTTAKIGVTVIDMPIVMLNKISLTVPPEVKAGESFLLYGNVVSHVSDTVRLQITNLVTQAVVFDDSLTLGATTGYYYKFNVSGLEAGEYSAKASFPTGGGTVEAESVFTVTETPLLLTEINLRDDFNAKSLIGPKAGEYLTFTGWVDGMLQSMDDRHLRAAAALNDVSGVDSARFIVKTSRGEFIYPATSNGNSFMAALEHYVGSGKADVFLEVEKNDGAIVTFAIRKLVILIDPSGYVYDAATGARIAGAEVTLYYKKDDGTWDIWPAENFDQINPQYTDTEGNYGWMVPEGTYEVRVKMAGYKDYSTLSDGQYGEIPVLPPQMEINIPIVKIKTGGSVSSGGGGSVIPVVPAAPITVSKATLTYISGQNRVETSVAISRQGWTSAETVILAPGGQNNLIDALAVAPLAGQEKAPILLSTGSLDPNVVAEIQRLGAKKIYAVGAISSAVIEALQAALPGVTVEVLKGSNRFETANLVSAKLTAPQGTFVVGYNAIADAVSAASFAAANGYAIQIANPNGSVSAAPTGTAYILGGPTLVSDVAGATRLYGATRYETNKAIRDALTFEYTNIYTADGNTLVDALTGSALAAQTKAAIVLTPGHDPTGVDFGKITTETKVYAFGGAK
ncbi:MAG: cell wall-binding repeat-containing protein [Gracilibacteraceae bacterium]|nr:cell wall-binding repeat-containing protein [Gracilibacteraceae bacterium]